MGVVRGCGSRVAGGIYFTCPLSPYGMPLEDFLVDPPIPVDTEAMGVTPIGVKLVERKGVWHVMDWVGSTFYPNPSDWIEECRRYGLSRRAPTSLDFQKLTPQSRILLMHSRAYIYNYDEYQKNEPTEEELQGLVPYPKCPKNLPEHLRPKMDTMCARLWYQDVTGGEPAVVRAAADMSTRALESGAETESRLRCVTRKMPAFEYHALEKPEGVEPKYRVAIFASFPITNLAVVKDNEGGTHNRSMMLAQEARIPVELVDE